MSAMNPSFLSTLQSATQRADAAEAELQKEIVERRRLIEQDRKFAYRRFNFMRTIVAGVASAKSEEIAVANALAAMRNALNWASDSEVRQAALSDFAPVAIAIFVNQAPLESEPPEADVLAALATFEAQYVQRHGSPFWVLFENYFPETPVVDF